MHTSIIKEIRDKYLSPMASPVCDIIDFHMHVGGGAEDRKYHEIAAEFGVSRAGAMLHGVRPAALQKEFGEFYFPIAWMGIPDVADDEGWIESEIIRIRQLASEGVVALKLRSACKEGRPEVWIDHPFLLEVLREVESLGLLLYIHIADPSVWWGSKFDPKILGDKIEYHRPVENILTHCPDLKVIGAHMGGYPEDLPFLGGILDKHDNYYVDSSATKWVVRELGRNVADSREFFIKYQDRICFGSDLVTFLSQEQEDYYRSRLWVLRSFFESEKSVPSMIVDPDALPPDYMQGPEVRGLSLSNDVLCKLYKENALRLLG